MNKIMAFVGVTYWTTTTNTPQIFFSPFPSSQKTTNVILNFGELVNINADAPAQGEADVLLGAISQLPGAENVLPRHQIQQEQHSTVGQVVLQLPVSTKYNFF